MKKLLALFLALCLLCAACPAMAENQTVGGYTFCIPDGMPIVLNEGSRLLAKNETSNALLLVEVISDPAFFADLSTTAAERNLPLNDVLAVVGNSTYISEDTGYEIYNSADPVSLYGSKGLDIFAGIYGLSDGYICFAAHCDAATNSAFFVYYIFTASDKQAATAQFQAVLQPILGGLDGLMVVVTADSAKVRGTESISGPLLKTAAQGEAFPYVGETSDWYIVTINGQRGYIHKGVSTLQGQ